jgi:uncharacterized protein (TIGR02246 family)
LTVVRTNPECATTETVVAGAIRAWNAGSATDFAGFFAENADLVNVHGMHLHGRQAIAGLYEMLFRSVFAKSSLQASVTSRKKLRSDVELVHLKVNGALRVSDTGDQNIVVSAVLTHQGNRWMIASMHNTLVSEARQ